jgi:hypothetical protein
MVAQAHKQSSTLMGLLFVMQMAEAAEQFHLTRLVALMVGETLPQFLPQ